MQWKELSRGEACKALDQWQAICETDTNGLDRMWAETAAHELNSEYQRLREQLLDAYKRAGSVAMQFSSDKTAYLTDLRFGLELYRILDGLDFTVRVATHDPVWIYIAVRVIPDVIADRYGKDSRRVQPDRYYAKTRRIYPKLLWWYVHLSLVTTNAGRPDYEATWNLLKGNTTDEIVQIVDRSGRGYRVDVAREILRYYSNHRERLDNTSLRKALVLHTARANLIEPELALGGVRGYVKGLFDYIGESV